MTEMSHGRLLHEDPSPLPSHGLASTRELGTALLARLEAPEPAGSYLENQRRITLFRSLRDRLDRLLDTGENRLTPRHIATYFGFTHYCVVHHGLPLRGATYLDVGCGSVNPFGRMFAHLMAGAFRAGCLELDPLQHPASAARALAQLVAAVAVDPSVVFAGLPVRAADCLANVADFDTRRLAAGDLGGIPPDRLRLLTTPLAAAGIPDGYVDVVVSNSVLEHVADPEPTLREMARVTRPGGFAMHGIDVADHRSYAQPQLHRLEFLTHDPGAPIVHGCNRLRLVDFERLFAAAGFDVLARMPGQAEPIPPELRRRLLPPWRGLPDADLATTWCNYLLRRR